MITHTGTYAIRAVVYLAEALARDGADANVTAEEIAHATHAPQNYLTKILHALVRAGLLDSTRGPRGGFRLAEGAEGMTLKDVLKVFENVPSRGCLLSQEGCIEGVHCPSFERCLALTTQVDRFLSTTRVLDLAGA